MNEKELQVRKAELAVRSQRTKVRDAQVELTEGYKKMKAEFDRDYEKLKTALDRERFELEEKQVELQAAEELLKQNFE